MLFPKILSAESISPPGGMRMASFLSGGECWAWNSWNFLLTRVRIIFFFPFFFFFPFIFISWRLITLQYCSGFCHTLTWNSHGSFLGKHWHASKFSAGFDWEFRVWLLPREVWKQEVGLNCLWFLEKERGSNGRGLHIFLSRARMCEFSYQQNRLEKIKIKKT